MSEPNTQTTQTQTQTQPTEPNTKTPEFDYEKLANIITGKQTVAEDTVLKSYFKQQGLSADEVTQAINAFKEPNTKTPEFDYEKLANIITGKQTVAEDTVLKSYFKQQGLSADEVTQAINAFKETKAKNTPDVKELQTNLSAEKSARLQAEINQSATLEAISQGVDIKSIPYVLKMADFKDCINEKGDIDTEKMKTAIKTVLDDVPALKGSNVSDNNSGFQKIGGDGDKNNETTEEALRGIFGIKK